MPDSGKGDWKSSMAQDVSKGRKTEVLFMNGYVAQEGVIAGVPTPVNTAITKIIDEIDSGIRTPDVDNIGEVLRMAGI